MDVLAKQEGSHMLANVTGIIFLLDDVIYDQQDWLIPAISFAAVKLGLDPDRVAQLVDEYVHTHHKADPGIYNHILLSCGQSDSIMNIRAFVAWVNRYSPAPGSLFMNPGVPEALDVLRFSHETALLVEGPVESQKARIAALDCGRFFKHILYADEIDGHKSRLPNDRGFRALISRMKSNPAEILFVGCHPGKHFSVPARLGCRTARCMTGQHANMDSNNSSTKAQYHVTSAARIPSLLGMENDHTESVKYPLSTGSAGNKLDLNARA